MADSVVTIHVHTLYIIILVCLSVAVFRKSNFSNQPKYGKLQNPMETVNWTKFAEWAWSNY